MAEQQRGWPRAGLAQHIPQRGLAQEARSIEYGKHHQRPATAHYSERRCEHSALRSRLRTSKDHGLSRCLVLRCPCWPAVAFGARDRGPGERQTRVRVLCAVANPQMARLQKRQTINFQRRVAERRLPAVAWQRLFLLRRCALGKPKRTLRRRAVMVMGAFTP